jgi:hypothetical protein
MSTQQLAPQGSEGNPSGGSIATQREKPLGQSNSRNDGIKAALKIFNYWRMKVMGSTPIHKMTPMDIENDNLQDLLMKYARWSATRAIPRHADANLEPKKKNEDPTYLTANTLTKYFEDIKNDLKKVSPNHEGFKNDSEWFNPMRDEYKRECIRNSLTNELSYGNVAFV